MGVAVLGKQTDCKRKFFAPSTAQKLGVALRPEQEIPYDEQRPPFPQDVEGAGQSAVLVVGSPGHETIDF